MKTHNFRNTLYSQEDIMKLRTTNIYFTHKSSTCFSKVGVPLSEYGSFREAQESSQYLSVGSNIKMVPYMCSVCNKYHLKPEEYYCNKITKGCNCRDHNGNSKYLYATLADAEKMVKIRAEAGVKLSVYKCPDYDGYHLTSSKGY